MEEGEGGRTLHHKTFVTYTHQGSQKQTPLVLQENIFPSSVKARTGFVGQGLIVYVYSTLGKLPLQAFLIQGASPSGAKSCWVLIP